MIFKTVYAYGLSLVEAFVLAFGAVATATDGGFTKAALLGGAAAGLRAVYSAFAVKVEQPKAVEAAAAPVTPSAA